MGEMLVTFFHLLSSFSHLLNLRQILVFLLEKAFLKMAKNPPPTSNSLGLICSLAYWKSYTLYTFELFFRRKGFSIHQGNTDSDTPESCHLHAPKTEQVGKASGYE